VEISGDALPPTVSRSGWFFFKIKFPPPLITFQITLWLLPVYLLWLWEYIRGLDHVGGRGGSRMDSTCVETLTVTVTVDFLFVCFPPEMPLSLSKSLLASFYCDQFAPWNYIRVLEHIGGRERVRTESKQDETLTHEGKNTTHLKKKRKNKKYYSRSPVTCKKILLTWKKFTLGKNQQKKYYSPVDTEKKKYYSPVDTKQKKY